MQSPVTRSAHCSPSRGMTVHDRWNTQPTPRSWSSRAVSAFGSIVKIVGRAVRVLKRMPIEFLDSSEGRKVAQSFDSPTVYLDHWAIRLFSDDRALQDRLLAALLVKRGTLLVSIITMAELGAASDPRHIIDAEAFLERCLPHLFLSDFRLGW